RYGHGLVMQAAFAPLAERAELAIRIEASNRRLVTEHTSDSFDFFFGALLHHELATDTAHEKRKIRSVFAKSDQTRFGGISGAVDQIVHIGFHKLRRPALWDVPRERHRLGLLAHGQNGAYEAVAALRLGDD